MTAGESAGTPRDDVTAIVARLREALDAQRFPLGVRTAARAWLLPLGRTADYGVLRTQLESVSDELGALLSIVRQAESELDRVEGERAEETRFGEVWWQQRQRTMQSAATAEDRAAAWRRVFVEALVAERYDVCRMLASPELSIVPGDTVLVGDAQVGAAALARRRLGAAAPMLRAILDGARPGTLPGPQRTALECLLTRALLGCRPDRQEALYRLRNAAAALAPDAGAERALLAAARGECALADGDLLEAKTAFESAVVAAPDEPAGYVGLGLVEEREQAWFRAKDYYDRAAAKAPEGYVFGRLFAPAPGNLYWRVARRLRRLRRPAEALAAVEEALERGLSEEDPFGPSRALADRAHLLVMVGRRDAAAASFYEAGSRYQRSGDEETAREHLEQACQLGPDVPAHHWALSESLRSLAYKVEGDARRSLLGQALRRWREGERSGQPDAGQSWAYVTLALTTSALAEDGPDRRDADWAAAATIQRALLLDDTYSRGWAFLGMQHNAVGTARTALAACDRALALDPYDELAATQRVVALVAVGRIGEAREALDGPGGGLDPAWVRYEQAYVSLVAGDPGAALKALEATPTEDESAHRWLRAACLLHAGRDAEFVQDMRWLWEHRDEAVDSAGPDSRVAWAAYALGDYDTAEALCREQLGSPPDPSVVCDLGTILLARGDEARDDLRTGAGLLDDGVAAFTKVDDLILLVDAFLPELDRRAAGTAHAAFVRRTVARVTASARRRRAELADGAYTAVDELAAVLEGAGDGSAVRRAARGALGLLAGAAGRWEEAAQQFRALADAGEADGHLGLLNAVRGGRSAADEDAGAGRTERAGTAYAGLLAELDAATPGPADDRRRRESVRAGLLYRAGLCAAALGDGAAAGDLLVRAASLDVDPDEGLDMPAVARIFVLDVASYWRQVDALSAARDVAGLRPEARGRLGTLLASTTLDRVYGTRRSDADSTATFPLTNPIVVELGAGLVGPDTSERWVLFQTLLPGMRDRVERTTGIRPPGIKVRSGPGLAATDYRITFQDVPVRCGRVDAGPGPDDEQRGLTHVVEELESFVRANLARLFGPDDLMTWAPDDGLDDAARECLADRESRLVVHRTLRLLVREGVPLTRRAEILNAVAAAMPAAGGDVLRTLRSVRARLAPALPPARDDGHATLPADLEAALAAGLTAESGGVATGRTVDTILTWQLPWADAQALTTRLQDRQADGPVVVRDADLRPFVWRLLAAGPYGRAVLAEDEVRAARAAATARTAGNGGAYARA